MYSVKELLEKRQKSKDDWNSDYEKAQEDLYFLSDEDDAQWNAQDLNQRRIDGLPALTIDQLSQFIHQVVNDIRMNTPTINVIPKTGADKEAAQVNKELIRAIQRDSNADAAYDAAVDFAVRCSIGFIRVDHEYIDDTSFQQKLVIKPVMNPLGVWIDPDTDPIDFDSRFAFIDEEIDEEEFKRLYPKFSVVSVDSKNSKKGKIVISECFYIEETPVKIGLRYDGNTEIVQEGGLYVAIRNTITKLVRRVKMSGQDILEETTFPGKYIPIIPVYGELAYRDGERHIYSLIRKSKDSQRLYNFWRSKEAELLKKQTSAQWLAGIGQIENFADDWKNPDGADVLRYNAVDAQGNALGAPQRLAPPQIPIGIVNAAREAVDDIKATMGLYNASIGQRSNETSGIAIERRKIEGDVATFHFGDNLVRSLEHLGKVLLSAIPEIYDTPQFITVIDDEDEPKTIGINGALAEEQEVSFDLTQGQYGVTVTTGAPFTTQRQEAATYLGELMKQNPEFAKIFGDLMFENSDFPAAQAIAKRLKKLIDPKLLEDSDDEESQAMQAQLQQSQQAVQQLTQMIAEMEEQLNAKQDNEQAKIQLETAKVENDSFKTKIDAQNADTNRLKVILDAQLKDKDLAIKEKEVDSKIAGEVIKTIAQTEQSIANSGMEFIGE